MLSILGWYSYAQHFISLEQKYYICYQGETFKLKFHHENSKYYKCAKYDFILISQVKIFKKFFFSNVPILGWLRYENNCMKKYTIHIRVVLIITAINMFNLVFLGC